MHKIWYWIKKSIKRDLGCKGFCPGCPYYEKCRYDLEGMKKKS